MPYFSTDRDGLGEFGCGADCPCKECRSAANVGEVYEKGEIAPPARAKPPTAHKMGGWFGEPPLSQRRVSVMPGQLRKPPFEVLIGYAPGQWRLNQARLGRIQRVAEHIARTWTTASPVSGIRLIGFAEPVEAQAALQRAVAARDALTDAIKGLNPGILRGITFGVEGGGLTPVSNGTVPRVEILLWVGHPFSRRLGSRARYSVQLGEAAPAPAGLRLLEHIHFPKKPDPRVSGAFITGPATKMVASDLNPGFIDASDNLITDRSSNGLQTCLEKLITTRFQNYLANKSNTAPSTGDRLRVALVDLTGNRIAQPDFAGWASTTPIYGASVPKILAVYAAYQLRMDLRQLARSQGISNGKALEKAALQTWKLKSQLPHLVWLFDIRSWTGNPKSLDFTTAAQKILAGIMHNAEAGELIVRVGFPYIASVTWQSGLLHPARGGLWLTTSYGRGQSGSNPVKAPYSANVTARAAATYFTLLRQGRLVDDAASTEIRTILRRGCVTGLFPALGERSSKCGIWSDYTHDCALIDRGSVRYVVAGLTRTKRGEYANYSQLFTELDELIVRNNQKPKPPCS
jgi:hypothetical protein